MWAARRGQASFEFFIAFSFLLLLFLVSLEIYEDEINSAQTSLSQMSAQSAALEFSRSINGVYRCGNGCSYTLQLKQDYILGISGREVDVWYSNQTGKAPIVTDTVNLQSATPGSYIVVTNDNGVVEVHDA